MIVLDDVEDRLGTFGGGDDGRNTGSSRDFSRDDLSFHATCA
jgi:hypothetical protein